MVMTPKVEVKKTFKIELNEQEVNDLIERLSYCVSRCVLHHPFDEESTERMVELEKALIRATGGSVCHVTSARIKSSKSKVKKQ